MTAVPVAVIASIASRTRSVRSWPGVARWLRTNSAEAATAMAALIMPEPGPLSDAVKATTQTNSGAGSGTAKK